MYLEVTVCYVGLCIFCTTTRPTIGHSLTQDIDCINVRQKAYAYLADVCRYTVNVLHLSSMYHALV